MDQSHKDTLIVLGMFVLLGAGGVLMVDALLGEVSVSTKDSPLGQRIANTAILIATLAALTPLLQVRRIIITQSSSDVSITFFAFLASSYIIGAVVGVVAMLPVFYIPNTIGSVTVVTALATVLMMRWRWRNWDELEALRSDDAAQGALIELDTESEYPATLNEDTVLDS